MSVNETTYIGANMNENGQSQTTSNLSERLIDVQEASHFLSLSRTKLYGLMDKGELEYVKIGRSRRIPISAVYSLIEASRVRR